MAAQKLGQNFGSEETSSRADGEHPVEQVEEGLGGGIGAGHEQGFRHHNSDRASNTFHDVIQSRMEAASNSL